MNSIHKFVQFLLWHFDVTPAFTVYSERIVFRGRIDRDTMKTNIEMYEIKQIVIKVIGNLLRFKFTTWAWKKTLI